MSDFGKGWPLCLQPLPLTSSFRNVLTQNRSSSCSALVLSRCGLSPRLAFLSSSPSALWGPSPGVSSLAPMLGSLLSFSLKMSPSLALGALSSPGLFLSCFLPPLQHYLFFLSPCECSPGYHFFFFPPLSPWAISRPWLILALMFTTYCTGNLSIRPSTQTPHLLDTSAWRFHWSKRTCFRFLPVIALSFSSISGNDLTASLLAQTRNLGVILRDLFILALLIGAVKSLFLLILFCSSPHYSDTAAVVRSHLLCSCSLPCSLISSPVSAFHSEWFFLHVNLIMLSLCSKFFSGSSQPVNHKRSTIRSSWRVRTHRSGNIPHPLACNLPISSFCLLLSSLLSSSSDEGLLVPKQAKLFDTWEPLIMKLLPLPRSLCPCLYPPPTQPGLHLLIVQGSATGPSS